MVESLVCPSDRGKAVMKKSNGRPEWFKFWRNYRRILDIEQLSMGSRGVVFTNMMRYFDSDENLMPMSDLEAIAFNVIKNSIDDCMAAYAVQSAANRENGLKGGRPSKSERKQNNQVGVEESEKSRRKNTEDRIQRKEERSVSIVADKPPHKRFIPPSFEDVSTYCMKRDNGIDPQRFLDYYTANGWVQGKGKPIRDWKACVRTWEHREQDNKHDEATNLSWRTTNSVTPDDMVEYPPSSGKYCPRWEVPDSG